PYTQMSFIGHFYSPLPRSIQLPELTSGGEIFATDWLGSGLGSGAAPEPVPGTQIGQFMRATNAGNLQNVINTYNGKYAGTLTPAGHPGAWAEWNHTIQLHWRRDPWIEFHAIPCQLPVGHVRPWGTSAI